MCTMITPRFFFKAFLFILACMLFAVNANSGVIEIRPTLSISEEYTDNYFRTQNNKKDEFSTIYSGGVSFRLLEKNNLLFFEYNPTYTDYQKYSENSDWRHEVLVGGEYQIFKYTQLAFSDSFVKDTTRSIRTNTWATHQTNETSVSIENQFGEDNRIGAAYSYSFDDYESANLDEYKRHSPSVFMSYWFTPRWGLDVNGSYAGTEYEIATNDQKAWEGDIRLLRRITPHFDIYVQYAHTFIEQDPNDHSIYNPSVGFSWSPTEDSNISLGLGILFHDHEIYQDSKDFFIDLDVYKSFVYSPRTRLSITGSSGYRPLDSEAAGLGFNTYYEAGALLSHMLAKDITAELSTSYLMNDYNEPRVNRKDKTLSTEASLTWTPLRWLGVTLSYAFNDFQTNSTGIEDYQENVGSVTVSFYPSTPIRTQTRDERSALEDRLFDR